MLPNFASEASGVWWKEAQVLVLPVTNQATFAPIPRKVVSHTPLYLQCSRSCSMSTLAWQTLDCICMEASRALGSTTMCSVKSQHSICQEPI